MMLRILAALRASTNMNGLLRSGPTAGLMARRALSVLSAPLLPGIAVVDLHSTPDVRWPALELLAGTALVGMALLWFRRSRRQPTDAEQQAPVTEQQEPRPAAAPRQTRAPLRIRGLLLLNLKPTDGMEQIETAPPLGPREDVIRSVQTTVPGLAVDSAGRGEVAAGDYRLAVDLGPHDPVHAMIASAEGDTGIEMLRTLVQSQGWRAYAAKAGVFIEPDALDLFALPDALPSRGQP